MFTQIPPNLTPNPNLRKSGFVPLLFRKISSSASKLLPRNHSGIDNLSTNRQSVTKRLTRANVSKFWASIPLIMVTTEATSAILNDSWRSMWNIFHTVSSNGY